MMRLDEERLTRLLGMLHAKEGECPAPDVLRDWANGHLNGEEKEDVEVHLRTCHTCMEEVFLSSRYLKDFTGEKCRSLREKLSGIISSALPSDPRCAGFAWAFAREESWGFRRQFQKIVALYHGRRYAEALERLRSLAAAIRDSEIIYFDMGISQLALEQYGQAERCFRKAIAIKGNIAEFYWYLSISLIGQGKFEALVNPLERLLILDSDYASEAAEVLRMLEESGGATG